MKKKKIKVLDAPENSEGNTFMGVQLNEDGDIIIIDLRGVKQIVRDSQEKIKHLLLRLRMAATPQRVTQISDQIGEMTRKFLDYSQNRNN